MLAVLRLMFALLFLQHGLTKLIGFPAPQPEGFQLVSLYGLAALIETAGGILVFLGLFTRAAAFIMAGEMAVAYFMAHAGSGAAFYPINNHGELAIAYCFVFLYLSVAGPGAWAIDSLRRRKR